MSVAVESKRHEIKRDVLDMYMNHPFPQWSKEERRGRMSVEVCRYKFLGLAEHMKGARFIEVGCGTGMRSMLAAQHFGVKEFVGFDHSRASLDYAARVAREEEFDRFTPVEGDLFNIPYPDETFDIVVSYGVLHHTHDPLGGFKEMLRLCKPGGFVAIYLYNKWNHWRHNMQKDKVSRLAGPDYEKRFEVAHRLYGTKPVEEMTPAEIAYFYDKYCHPHKSDHTYGETLKWFNQFGLEYWGSFPPLRLRDALGYIQYRGEIADRFPLHDGNNKRVVELACKLPSVKSATPPYKKPSALHNLFWQSALAWIGRGGEYSEGSALAARKSRTQGGR
ncbi:MAG TPA: class I SAM-dependent methyltransferase [Pyrinomonadaceae bacterium]|nr:class I SAM-dependent methyltransferase [Pyrinomonadaceae bacterium]